MQTCHRRSALSSATSTISASSTSGIRSSASLRSACAACRGALTVNASCRSGAYRVARRKGECTTGDGGATDRTTTIRRSRAVGTVRAALTYRNVDGLASLPCDTDVGARTVSSGTTAASEATYARLEATASRSRLPAFIVHEVVASRYRFGERTVGIIRMLNEWWRTTAQYLHDDACQVNPLPVM